MLKKLMALHESGNPIQVSIIGCGRFGSMMIAQIAKIPGMRVAIACDIITERARKSIETNQEGIKTIATNVVSEANYGIQQNIPITTESLQVAIESEIDVVVEATGLPDVGAHNAFTSILNNKHVIMVNVEADVLVGPLLRQMADSAGVIYSLAYGDQPAIIEEMYDWATSLGFEVIAAGKGTKYLPEYRKGTPNQALDRYGYSSNDPMKSDLNPQMYNSFLDGTKSAIEMCSVANMTGLTPDVPGMHFPPAGIKEIPRILIPREDGGILCNRGIVDIVSSLNRDGSEVLDSIRWGVFIVITSDSNSIRSCLTEYGLPTDPSGVYSVVHRPYHLVGMEAPVSIAKAVLYGEATGSPKSRVCEVVAVSKRALSPGEILDGEGGSTVYGILVDAIHATIERLVPIGLCHGAKVVRPVVSGQTLSYSHVEFPNHTFANTLRSLQLDSN